MRKTKIVCTMGPACDNELLLGQMIDAGMNVARFNMSHGTHEEQKARIDRVKAAIAKSGKTVALLLDTKGPEVRIGTFPDGKITLADGQEFSLMRSPGFGNENCVSISYPRLIDALDNMEKSAAVGMEILMDDGKISLRVKDVLEDGILCTVSKGGVLSNRKSINVPSLELSMPYISQTDRSDIEFGVQQGITYVAASFVRSDADVVNLRDFLDSLGHEEIEIISKIENQQGVDNIDDILAVSDGIMVARGDMGVEIPFIKLPAIQKEIIRKCVASGKYVITATQMLESMTTSPRPTRAEISDVANAVFDGTSAVMLSGESAAGRYPLESVRALAAICQEAEKNAEYLTLQNFVRTHSGTATSIREAICLAAKQAAANVNATAIIAESKTGRVARTLSHYRPACPIIAVVTSKLVANKLSLNWGITSEMGEEKVSSDEITRQSMEIALKTKLVKKGDYVIIISSNRDNPTQNTDTLNIRIV